MTKVEVVTDNTLAEAGLAAERDLIEALQRGEEVAFLWLVEQFHTLMVQLARHYVKQHEIAEEVVQETWLGVWRGLKRFESRSSLKTWIFHILTNQAKLRAKREAHYVLFSDVLAEHDDENEAVVDPNCFTANGNWQAHPPEWSQPLEEHVVAQEMYGYIQQAVQTLPPIQALVITLHDMEGWAVPDICEVLGLSASNQRVLLHRARAKVRNRVAQYFEQ